MTFEKLDSLKAKLDSYRPLPEALVQNIHEDLVLRWTYHSNAIEGNTFTLKETKVALEGITIGGKTLQEHFEAINHRDAILYLEELIKEKLLLTLRNVKEIHSLILKNIDNKNAGVWRNCNVTVAGADHFPPEYLQVPNLMEEFENRYKETEASLHPVEHSARIHSEFVKIHPFIDGNGRTARLLMNLELMKKGYPPVILPVEKRLEYYEALDMHHTKNEFEPFLLFIKELAEGSFDVYWRALGVK